MMLSQFKIQSVDPYFERERFLLYQGNSLKLLQELPEDSVDMLFADPPYNLSNGGFTCQGGRRVSVNKGKWDQSKGVAEDFEFHREWIKQCRRVLKPSGTIWLSGSYHSIYACGYALLLEGFKILNDVTWFKPNGAPNLSCRYFTASHETLIWAVKDPKAKHTFNYEAMKNGEWKNDIIKRPNRQMRSVWSISTPRGEEKKHGKHPTQKPMSLLDRVILSSTREGDVVVDPFSGSATTGITAYKHGRKYIGIELEDEFLELSVRRFEAIEATMAAEREAQDLSKLPEQAQQKPGVLVAPGAAGVRDGAPAKPNGAYASASKTKSTKRTSTKRTTTKRRKSSRPRAKSVSAVAADASEVATPA